MYFDIVSRASMNFLNVACIHAGNFSEKNVDKLGIMQGKYLEKNTFQHLGKFRKTLLHL